jgi:hypothetical protein
LLRNDFQITNLIFRILAPVRFHQPNDDIHALLAQDMGIIQHVVGFADARRRTDVDAEPWLVPAASRERSLPLTSPPQPGDGFQSRPPQEE